MNDAAPVRGGDELDPGALRAWLAASVPELVPTGSTIAIRQFPAGFSNLTYELTVRGDAAAGLPVSVLVLRRPPHGVTGGVAHDMVREHGILAALHPLGLPVPRPLAVCADASVIGAPFYVMAHVDGLILRGRAPSFIADAPDRADRLRAIARTVATTLAALHAVPVTGTPLAQLGRPDGYVARQVQGWTTRWQASRTHDVPDMDRVAAWLAAHRPPERGVALVHNDFKLDNLVLDPHDGTVRAILDWEMATVGDPLMDLGTTLAYWVEADDAPIFRSLGLGITALPGMLTRAELVQAYADARGAPVPDVPFYLAFGLFKVAVIAQQIFARHRTGASADPRFAQLGEVVARLADRAITAIDGGS